ncbi:putative histone-lysine N-methyltransferase PRDM6 isoform X2 [Dendronephthya gigantea]|uniref:putative histone-lysine N-methyltransferase PRDM6 isoform X2 n=1 Tax=Dendronephthya gigantea TaxID=151771 RepID=UPI00106C1374|nr:putative histone-lysine N-methyltransferase PRDM6 isoform X2 [Dendronephthya gigantea]
MIRTNEIYDFMDSYKDSASMFMSRRKVTPKELDFYLYGRTDVSPVKLEDGSSENETQQQQSIVKKIPNYSEKSVDILQLRYKPGVEKEFRSSEEFNKVLAAIKCIPAQLYLCYSSIPGTGFGICATEVVPSGTWIGPYEGRRVTIKEIGSMLDTRYVWEIYKNGVLDHGIDGLGAQGDSTWCWMKYIQCARNISEQNTVAFQFGADIYYQTYKTIQPGEEVLVWYAEYYEQHHGIPVGVRKITKKKSPLETETATTEILKRAQRNISDIKPSTSLASSCLGKPQTPHPTPSNHPPSQLRQHQDKVSAPPPTPIQKPTQLTHPPKPQSECSPQRECPSTSPCYLQGKKVPNSGTVDKSSGISQEKLALATEYSENTLRIFKTRFWKCEHCSLEFPQKWALQVHRCPCVIAKPFLCSNCEKAFLSTDELQAHAQRCGGGRQYKCAYCGRSFLNVNILTKHLKAHRRGLAKGARKKHLVPIYKKNL